MRCRCASLKPGSTAAPLRVDHRRLRAAEARDLALAADAQNLVAADRDGLRHRAVGAPAVYTFALWMMMSIGPSVSSRWAPTISPAMSVAATIPTTR